MGTCFGHTIPCLPKNLLAQTTNNCYFWRQATDEQEADLISITSEEYQQKNSFIFRIIKYKGRRRKSTKFLDRFLERQRRGKYAKLANQNHAESLTDLQLQNLDVNHLITSPVLTKESILNYAGSMGTRNASRASSSLDLEWEHEFGQTQQNIAQNVHNLPTYREIEPNQDTTVDNCHKTDDAQSITQIVDTEPTTLGRRLVRVYATSKRNGSFSRTSSLNSASYNSTPESLEWDIDEDQQRQLYVEDDSLDHETLKLLHQIEQLKNQVLNETGDAFCDDNDNLVFNSKSQTHLNGTLNDILNIS